MRRTIKLRKTKKKKLSQGHRHEPLQETCEEQEEKEKEKKKK
eukprot:CAMPEP_0201534684 /NCGR_PEP_ID=MMETSP0161_2-20130828/56976_1 /ASSEMBLY_ACC=CAM_ASM_000251 /TAXON_ID=180227 /ORGANISM="Neoparamoeba aestuarina, Strain SoJaBio B1-5/56/2" /LENGTH=41 /DNA_ID= /DNA_START= /DNA_END= /DNA_ORIENTATION=